MTKALVFVESNTTGTGRLMARAAAALGFQPILLAADPQRYAYAQEDRLAVRAVDTQDEAAVADTCRRIASEHGLAGVTSSSEYFVAVAAAVAARLGLPAPAAEAIRTCSDKSLQRKTLEDAQVAVPRWRRAATVREATEAADQLGWPVVIKPVSGSGSIGVKLCGDASVVATHAEALLARDVNERGMPIPSGVLVEQLVEGPEYSVEVFSARILGITAKHLGPLPYFVEIGHDFPAELSDRDREAIERITLGALRALGLEVGPAHLELRLAPGGPVIIEVNPRLAGGYIPELVRLARGVDLLAANVRFAAGLPVELDAAWTRHAAIRFVLPPRNGRLVAIQGLAPASRESKFVEAISYRAPGDDVSLRGDFRDRIGHVIAWGESRADMLGALAEAQRAVSVVVEPTSGSARAGDRA